ncbi:MAG: hypothetical protein KGO02_05680 [Alphaproteobacteria bacterium]|nr:hypothetical protein [Alphaproteobacteria bacterium]
MTAVSETGHDAKGTDLAEPHSGWQVLIGFWLIAAVLFAVFLLYYIIPSPMAWIEAQPDPTPQTTSIHLSVGGKNFVIPANYIIYPDDRRSGAHNHLALFALMPGFHGYSRTETRQFADDGAQSRVVHMRIRADSLALAEDAQLHRVFMTYVINRHGLPSPFGLTEYSFRLDNGYRGQDLFVGVHDGQTVVLRCWRFADSNHAPDCMRDMRLGRNVALSYRFKRTYLSQWRQIASGVRRLVDGFEQGAP